MKKILLVALLLLITACHKIDPKQQKADDLVKSYIKKNISNQNKYEGLSFSRLIALRIHYWKTKEGDSLNRKIKLEEESSMQLDSQEMTLRKHAKLNWDKLKILMAKSASIGDTMVLNMNKNISMDIKFKGPLLGYKINYAYKTENNLRETIYHKITFHIDCNISKITSVKDTVIEQSDIDW